MDKKRRMNQVALLGAALILQYTAANEDEWRSATKDIAWRSRGLAVADVRRATSLACKWVDEKDNFQ